MCHIRGLRDTLGTGFVVSDNPVRVINKFAHLLVFFEHAIMGQWPDHEECDQCTEDCKAASDPEWASISSCGFGTTES